MEKKTLIKDLTETQLLSAIREMFPNRRVASLELEPLIIQSVTLEDLRSAITKALYNLENPSTAPRDQANDLNHNDAVNSFVLPDDYCRQSLMNKNTFTKSLNYPTRFHGQNFTASDQLQQYLENYCATREAESH